MAFKYKKISNPHTGQDILFLQTARDTNGQLLEMQATYRANSKEPPAHYHPSQAEVFTIIEGELIVRMDGRLLQLSKGDSLHIPAKKIHAMWNLSEARTVVNWKVYPAMDTEYLIETSTGLANDGKTNPDGMPHLLQLALMASKYSGVFRLARPSFMLQKILFLVLTPVAWLSGYRSSYQKYLD